MKAFHAYDIRGIYNDEFNKEDVYKIGFFLPQLLKTNKVLVGRDVRRSTPEIFENLCKGIIDSGADVYDIGLATTPMVYFATAKYDFDASVMITASHNPKEYNGLKISKTNALPVGYDSGLKELEEMIQTKACEPVEKRGSVQSLDVKEKYIEFLKEYTPDNLSDIKLAIDCSNGMAGLLIKDVFGDAPHYLYQEPDGDFPNHEANPLVPENILDLQSAVKEQNADLGMIFDGDGDRVMFTDETGKFISPDLLIALLADYYEGKGGKFLQDIRTSKAVSEYVGERFEMNMWRVGRAYAASKLREIDGLFGGELAGHYYFKDFFYSDSGLLAALIFADVFLQKKKQGLKVSDVIAQIERYDNSGEINFKIEQKKEAMEAVKDFYLQQKTKPSAFFDFDGYRIEYSEWWFNIRPSNTEPYLRLIAEAKNPELLKEKLKEIKDIIGQYK